MEAINRSLGIVYLQIGQLRESLNEALSRSEDCLLRAQMRDDTMRIVEGTTLQAEIKAALATLEAAQSILSRKQ